jgi:hypothetical protein
MPLALESTLDCNHENLYGIEERRRCLGCLVLNEWAKQRKEGTIKERVRNKLMTINVYIEECPFKADRGKNASKSSTVQIALHIPLPVVLVCAHHHLPD